MTPQAYDFAAAQNELATATTAAEKANAELSALQARLSEKQQSLAMIQQRRLDGGGSDEDAPMVHLLQLDIAGLEPLVAGARDRQQSAVEGQQAAQQQVQHCQQAGCVVDSGGGGVHVFFCSGCVDGAILSFFTLPV